MQWERLKIKHKPSPAFIFPISLLLQSIKMKLNLIQTPSFPQACTKHSSTHQSLLRSTQQCTKYRQHSANINSRFCIFVQNAALWTIMVLPLSKVVYNNLYKDVKKVQNPRNPSQFSRTYTIQKIKDFPIQKIKKVKKFRIHNSLFYLIHIFFPVAEQFPVSHLGFHHLWW